MILNNIFIWKFWTQTIIQTHENEILPGYCNTSFLSCFPFSFTDYCCAAVTKHKADSWEGAALAPGIEVTVTILSTGLKTRKFRGR